MAKNNQTVSINLSSQSGEHIENVFFSWAINSGKTIIILTELIALGALGYRFWVDHQIIDLHDSIKREQLLLRSEIDKEQEYRNIQTRVATIKTLSSAIQTRQETINVLFNAINTSNFSSPNLSISGTAISLDGIAPSVVDVNSFVSVIKKYPTVRSISLDDLESSDQGIKFHLVINTQS